MKVETGRQERIVTSGQQPDTPRNVGLGPLAGTGSWSILARWLSAPLI
jgi:hypothetical protein